MGWSVWKWVDDHFELEENNCVGDNTPQAPPPPSAQQATDMNAYAEFRVIVCCGAGSGGSSSAGGGAGAGSGSGSAGGSGGGSAGGSGGGSA